MIAMKAMSKKDGESFYFRQKILPFFLGFFFCSSLVLAAENELKITTYNLGLAHSFIPYADQRSELLVQNLPQQQSDFLCLQEVWTKEDQAKITQALTAHYPYHASTEFKQSLAQNKPVCHVGDLIGEGKFGTCLIKNCLSQKGDGFTQCVMDHCQPALFNLRQKNRQCAAALLSQVGESPLTIVTKLLNPFKRAGLFAYQGSSGLMLFSKYPLRRARTVEMTDKSTTNRRAAIFAEMLVPVSPSASASNQNQKVLVQTLCTHLTPNFGDTIPYTGSAISWEKENAQQIDYLLQFLQEQQRQHPGVWQFLVGDFNCSIGDTSTGLRDEMANNCRKMAEAGFTDPVSEQLGVCTYCADNSLVSMRDQASADVLIDHVFVKAPRALHHRESEIIFKDLFTIIESSGQNRQVHLSDHYGVRVSIPLAH